MGGDDVAATEVVAVAARIQALLAAATVVASRAAVSPEVTAGVIRDVRRLCAQWAVTVHADTGEGREDQSWEAREVGLLLALCAVSEATYTAARQVRREMWQRAHDKQLSQREIGQVCGVTKQAVAKQVTTKVDARKRATTKVVGVTPAGPRDATTLVVAAG